MLPPGGQTEVTAVGLIFKTALMAEPLKVAETDKGKLFQNNPPYKIKKSPNTYRQIRTKTSKESNVCQDSLPANNNNPVTLPNSPDNRANTLSACLRTRPGYGLPMFKQGTVITWPGGPPVQPREDIFIHVFIFRRGTIRDELREAVM